MTQRNPEFGAIHNADDIVGLTNLAAADFDLSVPIQTVSTGMPFTMVPAAISVCRGETSSRSRPRCRVSGRAAVGNSFTSFCRETVDPTARLHSRMIFYNGDDPATGSAAGCCAAWMVAHGIAASDERVLIEQGLEMHRPSRIFVRATHQKKCGG